MSAAAKAKREDPELEVVVLEQGAHTSYAACGMPYWLAGDVSEVQKLIARTPQQMATDGVRVDLHHQAVRINADTQTVIVRDLSAEREFSMSYDQLVIATGARAARLRIAGGDLDGVFGLRSLESGLALQRFLRSIRPRQP